MKSIKITDELYQHIQDSKAPDQSISDYIHEGVSNYHPVDLYPDYVKDLFKQVERLTVALEAAMSAKTQATTPQAQARPPRKDYIAEVRKLEAARDDELLWNQDPDDQAEIRNRYQSLIQEQWDLHHQSKN